MAYRGVVRLSFPLAMFALVLAACGGGNAGSPLLAIPSASPSAPPIPAAAPFTSSTSNPLPAVTAPPAGHCTTGARALSQCRAQRNTAERLRLPISGVTSIAANTTAVVTLSNQAPKGPPTTFARSRDLARRYDARVPHCCADTLSSV